MALSAQGQASAFPQEPCTAPPPPPAGHRHHPLQMRKGMVRGCPSSRTQASSLIDRDRPGF